MQIVIFFKFLDLNQLNKDFPLTYLTFEGVFIV